jgi:hypothetical protein
VHSGQGGVAGCAGGNQVDLLVHEVDVAGDLAVVGRPVGVDDAARGDGVHSEICDLDLALIAKTSHPHSAQTTRVLPLDRDGDGGLGLVASPFPPR